jgi:sugar phosphate isomerase/epimerase
MTLPHVHIPFDKIERYMDMILQNAFNLEIYFNADILDHLEPDILIKVKESLGHNPSISIHAPFMDLSPAAVDSKIREVTAFRLNQVLDIAGILHPLSVVCHSGYEKWKYSLNIDLWLRKSLETWKPLVERAKSVGCKIAIENIFEDEPSNLKALMEEMSSDNFGICFDTGHCNLFSIVPIGKWMEDLGDYIVELHLHDNDKSADQHYPIGDGTFDFDNFFRLLKNRDCIHTIEAHTPERLLKSIERLKKYTGRTTSD